LNGALVPIKNEGPELWDNPSIVSIADSGTDGAYDSATQTLTNTTGSAAAHPRFRFALTEDLRQGAEYIIEGRFSGDVSAVYGVRPRNADAVIFVDAETGEFSGTAEQTAASTQLEILLNAAVQSNISVTIESMSIREVIDDPINSPVGNGFVEGDYSRIAGLKGDGTSYIDTSRADSDDLQNNNHIAVFVNATPTGTTQDFAGTHSATAERLLRRDATTPTPISQYLNNDKSTGGTAGVPAAGTLFASSRISQSEYTVRLNGANIPRISASTGVNALNAFIFCRNFNNFPFTFSTDTLAFYSIGTSINLAQLDTRVSNLIASINLYLDIGLNPDNYDQDTINYSYNAYKAGGSLA